MNTEPTSQEIIDALFPDKPSKLAETRHSLRSLYENETDKTTKELLFIAYTIVDFVDYCKRDKVAERLAKSSALNNAVKSFKRKMKLDFLH
jgi:F0F1-type ATP synthase gamma subunit